MKPLKRFAGTAGVPPAVSAKREQFDSEELRSFGAFAGGTPAVPANHLIDTEMNRKAGRFRTHAIVGNKVLLRAPTSKDCAEFIALNRASRSFHRGLVSPPLTPEQFAAFLTRSNTETSICVFICLARDRSIIGAISLSQIFRGGFQNAYLGYYVGSRYAGQGYMTEALQLVLRYAFRDLKLHRLEANIQPGNLASIALVRRAGFVLEGYSERYLKVCGRWRDHERWAMLAENWRAKLE